MITRCVQLEEILLRMMFNVYSYELVTNDDGKRCDWRIILRGADHRHLKG